MPTGRSFRCSAISRGRTHDPPNRFGGEIGINYGEDDYEQVNGTFTGTLAVSRDLTWRGGHSATSEAKKGVEAFHALGAIINGFIWQSTSSSKS